MIANPQLMTAVEQLGYRVTCGDVATHAGINLEHARSGLLDLANQTGGHLQVTTTGELIYAVPKNFRQILLRKSVELRFQDWLSKVWTALFYLVKISFGILLIASISVVYLTILGLTLAALFSSDGGDCGDCGSCGESSGGNGSCVLDICNWGNSTSSSSSYSSSSSSSSSNSSIPVILNTGESYQPPRTPIREKTTRKSLNFLEAVFSVLFGDGDPNADLERRRWSYIGNMIHRNQGVAIAEQIAPYLDDLGEKSDREYENYMLPVLSKFNGIPEVSPNGQLVYHFPDLQTTLKDDPEQFTRTPQCLRERRWKFTQATPTQRNWAIVLFVANLIGIPILSVMLAGTGILIAIVPILFIYAIGLVTIPSFRYFWVKYQDDRVKKRNRYRHQQVSLLHQEESIPAKLEFAHQFAKQHKITSRDIVYTSEEDMLEQEFKKLEGD
jgi:hypothetical protein